jgi:hypothetical protein
MHSSDALNYAREYPRRLRVYSLIEAVCSLLEKVHASAMIERVR